MSKVTVAKIEVAESHLKWAIKLFFMRSDPAVIETLVGAASGVLRGIAKSRGVEAFIHDSDWIKPEYKGQWISTLHNAQNFFKHANKDADEVLEYETVMLQYLLLEACYLYRHLASDHHLGYRQSQEVLLYEIWFGFAHPNLVQEKQESRALFEPLNLPEIDPNDFEIFQYVLNHI